MLKIYDNIETTLAAGLRETLKNAQRADFCVGYFNLRGWREVADAIENLSGENNDYCRLLIGMVQKPDDALGCLYAGKNSCTTQGDIPKIKKNILQSFARQLARGFPQNADQKTLQQLAGQLRDKKLCVKLYTRNPLHAKLYLVHKNIEENPTIGFVGSSNLTFSGLKNNSELNVDVTEQMAAQKLSEWFVEKWEDEWSLDISDALCDIINASWAGGSISPYHIYIKAAWHLSRDALEEAQQFKLPSDLAREMLEHQKQAVLLAAQRLNQRDGVIIGDVVGLGKTMVATAVAKVLQEDLRYNVLIICPPALEEIWREYKHRYMLAADIMSLGKINSLEDMRHYHLVVIDESHNLRNRKSKRHRAVRDYIHANSSKVIMLTATPYNKTYQDIGSQLLLFNDSDSDLGIMPENYIHSLGGRVGFNSEHPNIQPSSLSAFERSDDVDDWRELMRLFMVRRTRKHIRENYADYDKAKKRHYLTFASGEKFYFPDRKVATLSFAMTEKNKDDQYAKLYSEKVVEEIGSLQLPRYGLKQFLKPNISPATKEDEEVMEDLSRAGVRLRGFARIGLFKRLESSGEAFIISLQRHILRNMIMSVAYEAGKIPIGEVSPQTIEEEDENNDIKSGSDSNDYERYRTLGKALYKRILDNNPKEYKWLSSDYFKPKLSDALKQDALTLLAVLKIVPRWEAAKDRKLQALRELCQQTHPQEKLLIFSQYKDTIEYLGKQFANIDNVATLHGDSEGTTTQKVIHTFSPKSNREDIPADKQIRILFATDKLSEGVNLQDAHIVVNYDLPWAIIRLIQRAGRVDRIGQQADTILCYSALPEDGIETIINLRGRLTKRITQSAELLGSDEKFFTDEKAQQQLRAIYAETLSIEEEDDETDLISLAHDIWQQAVKKNPKLKTIIPNLPDVVYAGKRAESNSVIAYIQNSRKNHILAEIDDDGAILSQSQFRLLEKMKCESNEPKLEKTSTHHELVIKIIEELGKDSTLGGQLGGARSVRRRVYKQVRDFCEQTANDKQELSKACEQIYQYPLKDSAREKFSRQLRSKIGDKELAKMALWLYQNAKLCQVPEDDGQSAEAKIICSMGLIK